MFKPKISEQIAEYSSGYGKQLKLPLTYEKIVDGIVRFVTRLNISADDWFSLIRDFHIRSSFLASYSINLRLFGKKLAYKEYRIHG